MRWLVRLVTPPGGIVCDPFMGSGSTGVACVLEGFNFIGIEKEADYFAIARARIDAVSPLLAAARVAPVASPDGENARPALGQRDLFGAP